MIRVVVGLLVALWMATLLGRRRLARIDGPTRRGVAVWGEPLSQGTVAALRGLDVRRAVRQWGWVRRDGDVLVIYVGDADARVSWALGEVDLVAGRLSLRVPLPMVLLGSGLCLLPLVAWLQGHEGAGLYLLAPVLAGLQVVVVARTVPPALRQVVRRLAVEGLGPGEGAAEE